jgi:hypothetical protein
MEIKNTLVPSILLLSPHHSEGTRNLKGQGRAQKTRSAGVEHLRKLGLLTFTRDTPSIIILFLSLEGVKAHGQLP